MSYRKISRGSAALALSLLAGTFGVSHAAPPYSVKSEEEAHPRLTRAIQDMEDALRSLKEAPDDFGGNKVAAIRDTQTALHSLRKALYFRLKLDDAAIDHVH